VTAGPDGNIRPVMELWRQAVDGTISLPYAETKACQLAGSASPPELSALVTMSDEAVGLAQNGNWQAGLILARLCRAAVGGPADDLAHQEALIVTSADVVEVVKVALRERGDANLYQLGLSVGQEAAALARTRKAWGPLLGRVLFRLGTMILDGYTAGRSSSGYQQQHLLWLQRGLEGSDPATLARKWSKVGVGPDATIAPEPARSDRSGLPAPLDALIQGEELLREACGVSTQTRLPRVLKALCQTLEWKSLLGGEIDRAELVALCKQGLSAVPDDDIGMRAWFSNALERAGTVPGGRAGPDSHMRAAAAGPAAPAASDSVQTLIDRLERDFDGFAQEHGQLDAWDACGEAVNRLGSADPARALRILLLRRRLSWPWDDDGRRHGHYRTEITLVMSSSAPDWAKKSGATPLAALAVRALREASDPPAGSTPRSRAAAVLAVMARAPEHDEERIALDLQAARRLSTIDPELIADHRQAVGCLLASLHQGDAVNRVNAGEHAAAVSAYMAAAPLFLLAGLSSDALRCCMGIDDMLQRGSITTVSDLTAWLSEWSLLLEFSSPDEIPLLQRLYARTVAIAIRGSTPYPEIQSLLQTAKGARTSALFQRGITGFSYDEQADNLLSAVSALEKELPADSSPLLPRFFGEILDEDVYVTSWVGLGDDTVSDTALDRLANAQRAFERHVIGLLAATVDLAGFQRLSAEQIQAALDPDTVLLQVFLGRTTDDKLSLLSCITTPDECFLAFDKADTSPNDVLLNKDGRTAAMSPLAMFVADLRRELQRDPRPRTVTRKAEDVLADVPEMLFRPLRETLVSQRAAGKTHLAFMPHGPLHFLPLELAGPPGHPLADDWVITYLPSLQLLAPLPRTQRGRRRGVAVFGLSYRDQPEMPPLPSSAEEAQAIAAALGVEPLLDESVTAESFSNALEHSRYAHIRAHGRHNVAAPLFQSLFLTPTQDHDGRFCAHEILPLDLRGLELVTLSACETALGRVDRADNLRGLPATLLAAGADAVVGTLWPVLADASTTFFREFYQGLIQRNLDPRTAYGEARQVVRAAFPAYRDWGAFYLVGVPHPVLPDGEES